MGSSQKQIMLEEEMCLKKSKGSLLVFIYILLFFKLAFSNQNSEGFSEYVINYFSSINNFSAKFIQSDGKTIEEGKLYIGEERLRIEYENPNKILIILDKNKAMFHNYSLDETEFFNPKDTPALFSVKIFKNQDYFYNMEINLNDNNVVMTKTENIDDVNYNIKIYFENNPLILRKIIVENDFDYLEVSLSDHNLNENYDKNFFKLINPKLLN